MLVVLYQIWLQTHEINRILCDKIKTARLVPFSAAGDMTNKVHASLQGNGNENRLKFFYLFLHFNLTPVRYLDCTSSLQPAHVLLHLFTSVTL